MGYAALADLYNYGAPPVAYGLLTNAQQQAALDAGSAHFDSKARARYGYQNVPLVPPIDIVIIMHVSELAAWNLINLRGFDGTNTNDVNIRDRGLMAMRWMDQVERQEAHPAVAIATTDQTIAAPFVLSNPVQGWIPLPGGGSSNPGVSGVD